MYWLALSALPAVLVALRRGVSPSRRVLACTLTLLIPVIGLLLAIVVIRVRGGIIPLEPLPDELERRLSPVDVKRLGEMPPVLERLLTGDHAERLEALVALSSAGDAPAVAVLRWAIEHGPPEVVLDAALTLEEIELRGEARMLATREMLGVEDAKLALAAADASAAPVLSHLADPAIAPVLAEQARTYYELALEWAPPGWAPELVERIARLELAVGRPRAALDVLDRLIGHDADHAHLAQLRDAAAFAAREFDTLSFVPAPLEVPPDLAARKLQTVLS